MGQIPGAQYGFIDNTNYGIDENYRYCDWYINAIFATLKEEIFESNKKLTIIEYENIMTKAEMKWIALAQTVMGANEDFSRIYDIFAGSLITLQHILSLLLYTNCTQLSTEFSKSFRKLNINETDKELKERHAKYAIWGRLLRETIECFGKYLTHTPQIKFLYHGLSQNMEFSGFNQRFCAPTSTSLREEVAVMFAAGMGIVLKIENERMAVSFWRCLSWSDFGAEEEVLFLGGLFPLNICGLSLIETGINYNFEVQTIKIFERGFMDGYESTIKVLPKHKNMIIGLINGFIKQNNENKPVSYVQTLFNNVICKKEQITIDILKLNKKIYNQNKFGTQYGYTLLRDIYLENDNRIKWKVIKQLYPMLRIIVVTSMMPIRNKLNGYKSMPSIIINDELLNDILGYISNQNNTWKVIEIHCPKNRHKALEKIMKKYESRFQQFKFKLELPAEVDGSDPYTVFFIIHEDIESLI